MNRTALTRAAFGALVAGSMIAGCSSNAGFGGAPPYNAPQPGPTGQGALSNSPYPGETPPEGATPVPNTPLTVDSADARFAYDGYAADPVKAPHLVEITFALNNPGASPLPVAQVAVATETAPPTKIALSLQAPANQDTVETQIAITPPKDFSKTKQLTLTFTDPKSTLLAQDTIDFPTLADPTMTALDKKRPAGGLSIDDIAVSSIQSPGGGLHYDLTFSATNAGSSDASIAFFTVTPPKSDTVKIAIPIKIPARTEMSPISVIVPYSGKSKTLPTGKYDITASDGKSAIAEATGPLL